MQTVTEWLAWVPELAAQVPQFVWVTIIATATVTLILLRPAKRALKAIAGRVAKASRPGEDILTIVAASIATGVSAQGMWRFSGDVLGFDGPLQLLLFAFIEVAVVTSAVRARRNMRENHSAGIDGAAVWALTSLSAVLSSMDARSLAEAVFRLAAPLVAAWLWERGMAIERHRLTGRSRIKWRLTPERAMVRLGLAEVSDRTASDVDAHRRLTRVALATKNVRQLRQSGASESKLRRALGKRDRALDQAVEHTDLARDTTKQTALLDLVTTLGGADSLSDLLETAAAPWAHLDHPAVTGAARHSDATILAAAMRDWTEAVNRQHEGDREVSAAVTSMAAFIAGRNLLPGATATSSEVADLVAAAVSSPGRPLPLFGGRAAASETLFATRGETSRAVADEVSDPDADEVLAALRDDDPDDGTATGDETETATASATDAMRRHWLRTIEQERRAPKGAELARVGGVTPQYGRRKRNEWLEQLDGRTRRALLNATKKATA
jgi:hypothetical protein